MKTEKQQTDIAAQIAAIKYEVKHLRNPINVKSDDWQSTADAWLFVFPDGTTQEYYTGIGHRVPDSKWPDRVKEFKRLKNANLSQHGLEQFMKVSKPVTPKIEAIIHSLYMDSHAESQSFADWCSDFGYDEDSRKALETYTACQKSAATLRKLGLRDFDALAKHFENY